jgi:hypothetical protein
LLVQSYIETYDISYPEALRRIEEEVNELKQHIETQGEYELNGIGVLRLNDEGHYEFEPCEAGILTPEYYGLSTFEMIPLSQQAQLVAIDAEEKKLETIHTAAPTADEQEDDADASSQDDDNDTIIIRMSWIRNIVAVAAAVVVFLMIGTPISNSHTDLLVQQSSMLPTMTIAEDEPAATEVLVADTTTDKSEQETPVAETAAAESVVTESIKDTFIKPKVSAWTQEITALYPITDIFGDKRTDINAHLDTYLREKFDPYGIIIDTVNFTNIEVDPETAAAIQKKVNAQQELELANIEAQTAKIQAEKDKEVAEIAAERKIIEANAAAESVRIAAQAEADANREISASLTDSLIQYTYAQNWNGELPKITGGGSTIVDASDYFGSQN